MWDPLSLSPRTENHSTKVMWFSHDNGQHACQSLGGGAGQPHGWVTAEAQVCHLIEDSASKSLRLSAMPMDSSIRGSFFCGDRSRCNTFQQQIDCFSGLFLRDAVVSVPFVFQPPALADSACSPAASCGGPEPPSWPVPLAVPPSCSQSDRQKCFPS